MQQREQIISELKRRGKRMTDQRKIMLDVILEGRWSSCKEIYYEASKRDPGIGKATVYRMIACAGRNRRFKPLPPVFSAE